MQRNAIIQWDPTQYHSIKRDLLFFDKFYFDPSLSKYFLSIASIISGRIRSFKNDIGELAEDMERTKDFLIQNGILIETDFAKTKSEVITKFIDKIKTNEFYLAKNATEKIVAEYMQNEIKSKLLSDIDNNSNWINLYEILNLFSNLNVDIAKTNLQYLDNTLEVYPILKSEKITCVNNIISEKYHSNNNRDVVVSMVLNKLPIPTSTMPFDEIIDFKEENRRIYLGLVNWMRKISQSNSSKGEIEEELEHLTLEYEHILKYEKLKYNYSSLELLFKLPFEVAENIVKFDWSKIPEIIFKAKKINIDYHIGESKASGKEIAYIKSAEDKFLKN